MISLDSTSKSLEVVLSGSVTTNQLPVIASYVDVGQTTNFKMTAWASNDTVTNNGTAVTAVAAPAANTTRKVQMLTVYNTDTAAATVTVQLNNSGTKRTIFKATLQVGDNLEFVEGVGFRTFNSAGSEKVTSISIGPGVLVQTAFSQSSAVFTATTVIPYDDTIPQNTEGDEFLTVSITPQATTNKLVIDFTSWGAEDANDSVSIALFQDSTANALKAANHDISSVGHSVMYVMRHEMAAGTTSSTTFKIRVGPATGGNTVTMNGVGGARRFGGVSASMLSVTEVSG